MVPKRLAQKLLMAVFLPLCALTLSTCGRSAEQYATQACTFVNQSISIYKQAAQDPSAKGFVKKEKEALALLRKALPLAALAAGTNGVWQALQATLSESNRVPESHLIDALSRQCAPNSQYTSVNIPASTVPSG